jgi:hypothetical protein
MDFGIGIFNIFPLLKSIFIPAEIILLTVNPKFSKNRSINRGAILKMWSLL